VKILAFDTATNTGCAFGVAGGTPRAWTVSLGQADWPVRFSKTLRMTQHYIEKLEPDLVAVEQFVGGPKANANLVGLVACVLGEATRLGVKTVTYYPASIRSHFLGRGRGKGPIKAQVFARCVSLGWNPKDSDQSDACALWSYACGMHSRAHQMTDVGGLFAGVRG
jgi:Holliday junction resolvasome RuvABC endonuclease subunit